MTPDLHFFVGCMLTAFPIAFLMCLRAAKDHGIANVIFAAAILSTMIASLAFGIRILCRTP